MDTQDMDNMCLHNVTYIVLLESITKLLTIRPYTRDTMYHTMVYMIKKFSFLMLLFYNESDDFQTLLLYFTIDVNVPWS